MKQLIKNGYIVDPATKKEGKYDLLIQDDKILQIAYDIEPEEDMSVIDASGAYILPGFIDLHVHLREPGFEYKETILTGAKAAARGGFTSICPMPNTKPVIDSPEMIQWIVQKAKEDAIVHVLPIGAITKGQEGVEVTDMVNMAKAGMVAVSEDGKSVADPVVCLEGMKRAKEAGVPVFAHCEDRALAGNGVMNEGTKALELGLEGISNVVEDIIVARDILLAKKTGAQLHLCHCSTINSIDLLLLAKKIGVNITAEVCPHHFTLADCDILKDHGNYKMNPPLRSHDDVQTLKVSLMDDSVDVIATDHAPHSMEEKNTSIKNAPFGIVGLETAFALAVTELMEQGYLTKMQLAEKMSYNPAKILGIDKGSLEVGKIADLVMVDFDASYKIDSRNFVSKGKNTPFHGKSVKGRVLKTWVSGKLVYNFDKEK